MNDFRFENTLKLSESQYVAFWALVPRARWRGLIRLFALAFIGIVFISTGYILLMLLGLILLGVVFITLFLPQLILPFGARSTFRQHKYLRDPLTYGASNQNLWIKGPQLNAIISWSLLVTWRETSDLLILSPSGTPPLYFSLARLREEGLYDHVRELAKRHGKEFKT